MKKLFACLILLALCAPLACSPQEEAQLAKQTPTLAPTTRAVERVQQSIDPIAQTGEQLAHTVQQTATDGAALGVPGAGVVALIATTIGTILGVYNERRKNTLPLRSAVQQIVQSIETAFPQKTDQQKSALASVQDQATKRLVNQIKSGP
jgi:hypothetical protein